MTTFQKYFGQIAKWSLVTLQMIQRDFMYMQQVEYKQLETTPHQTNKDLQKPTTIQQIMRLEA